MVQAKCLEKIRDKNNHIIGYKLIDKNKNTVSVKSDKLKEVIRSGQVEIINLTLTSDNRLIDKKPDTVSKPTTVHSSKPNINAEAIINKARAMGYTITSFDTDCGHKCYMASSTDNLDHILIIPNDVKYIYNENIETGDVIIKRHSNIYIKTIYEHLSGINGTLKVIGGKGLTIACCMFWDCQAQSLDLSSFDTSNITNMKGMFGRCKAQSINLSSFDTSNVTTMESMFEWCEAQSIDLSSFDTSNVTDMSHMFAGCQAQSINLSSFNTSKVKDMRYMFIGCGAQSIDLSSFDTSKVTTMESMFERCKAHSIDLTSFDTSKVNNMNSMFLECRAHSLDLGSFNTSKVKDMRGMFCLCKAQFIDLSSFDTSNVEKMYGIFDSCDAQIKVNDPKLKKQL